MPETVRYCEDEGFVEVKSHGDVTEDDLKKSLRDLVELSREHDVRKVFVDASEETSLPSAVGLHEFGSLLSQDILRIQFAVVMAPAVRKQLLFLETVTVNRGMRVKMFDDREAALEWLRG